MKFLLSVQHKKHACRVLILVGKPFTQELRDIAPGPAYIVYIVGVGAVWGGAGPAKRSAFPSFASLTFHLQCSHFLLIKKLAPAANSLRLSLRDLLLKGFCRAFNFSRFFPSREFSSLLSQASHLNHASPRVGPQETAL